MNQGIPFENAREYLDALDLSAVIERLVRIEKWRRAEAELASEQYRKYLYLKKKYKDKYVLPPSEDIDEVWHAHILHTKQYMDFCEEFFGKYLHHNPHLSEQSDSVEELNRLFAQTQEFYRQHFGDYIYRCKQGFLRWILFTKIPKLFAKEES